jgi:hypothetical protein
MDSYIGDAKTEPLKEVTEEYRRIKKRRLEATARSR